MIAKANLVTVLPLFLCPCADCAKLAGEMCELLHTSMIDYLDGNDKGGHTGGRAAGLQTQGMVGQAVGRTPMGTPSVRVALLGVGEWFSKFLKNAVGTRPLVMMIEQTEEGAMGDREFCQRE